MNRQADPLRYSPDVDLRLRSGDWSDLQIVSAAWRIGLPFDELASAAVRAMTCEQLLRSLPAANWNRPDTIAPLEPRRQPDGRCAWTRLDADRMQQLSGMTVSQYLQALPDPAVGYLGLLASSAARAGG